MKIDALRSKNGMITLLELDRVPVMADALGLRISNLDEFQIASALTKEMMIQLTPYVQGAVLSPEHSLQHRQELSKETVPVISLEKKTPAVDPLVPPSFVDNWGIGSVANNYGIAKLELYYHPKEENAAIKKQMVAELYDYCKYEGVDFILELLVYHQANEKPSPQGLTETQLTAVQEFRESCDLMALEYLGDSLAAVTITAELDIPWIMTSREERYDTTKTELRAALESGAQGFLLGDIFWPQLEHAKRESGEVSVDMLTAEVQKLARDHVIELSRIVNEFSQSANAQEG